MSLRAKYLSEGFLTPIRILSSDESSQVWKDYLKYVQLFGNNGKLEGDTRFRVHLLAPWAHDLVTNPTLVQTIKTVLNTPDIVCWSSDLCIKPPSSPGFFSWHQDSTYSGLTPPDSVVTAWLALTPTTRCNGCLQVLPQSHQAGQQEHRETVSSNNLLSLGQTIPQEVVDNLQSKTGQGPVMAELEPGEMSLHHWKCVHRSGPNTSEGDRVGLAIRYMTADVRNAKGKARERATLVSGKLGDHWDLEPGPQVEYGQREREEHRVSMEREKENYFQDKGVKEFK